MLVPYPDDDCYYAVRRWQHGPPGLLTVCADGTLLLLD